MITICEKHDDAIKVASQKFYRGRLDFLEKEELVELVEDMEGYFSDISDLISEAKKMGQSMEDGLKNRKEFMIKKGIEQEYQE